MSEIDEIVMRPDNADVRRSQSMVDDLRDAIDQLGDDADFDIVKLSATIDAFDKILDERTKKTGELRNLSGQARGLLATALDPATLLRLRQQGQEVALRAMLGALIEEMVSARAQAAGAAARIDAVLASLEAAR